MGQIGKREQGGVTRFSFTKEERKAKRLVASYMKEAGLEVTEDHAGNLVGRREGKDAHAPSVIIGSHIDTVKHGGIFDGALGVIAGIEVLQTMHERNIVSNNPIEVIAFSDEEGSRFNFGMIGSRALTGKLNKNDLTRKDQDGITIAEAMKEAGLDPEKINEVTRRPESIKCYLELHIEQGKVLESHRLSVGIVSGIAGPLWMKWKITGESGHAGATPMDLRRDPLIAFADLVKMIEHEAVTHPNTVATVGKVTVTPGGVNIIPKQVEFTLDLRNTKEPIRNKVENAIITFAHEICEKKQLNLETTTLQRIAPVPCSAEIQRIIEESCRELSIETMTLPSGAGHDGMQFNDVCPIGMIFIRSIDGISHNPAEFSSQADCVNGTNVLYQTVLKLVTTEI